MPLSPTLNPFEVAMTEPALTKEPSSPWSADQYLVHGQVQYFLGDYELSMAAFDQAISLDPWMMTDAFFLHQNARLNWDAMQSMVELDAQITELDRAIDESAEDAEG
jgi:tetratricopeptide (TPR) repeat protein